MYRYIEIADELEEDYMEKALKKGDKVGSVRDVCRKYSCHESTAMKALNYLKEKEILYSIPQSGFYIVGNSNYSCVSNDIIDFKSSSPDPNLFPYKDYQKCVNLAIEKNRSNLFQYSTIDGYIPLKKAIVKLVADDYIFTDTKNLVITTGIQQGLTLLTENELFNGKSKILIEQPSYHRYIEYLKHSSYDVVTIERSFRGIDLDEIEKLFSTGEIKFFYTMARVHNPLGTSLSKEQKEKLIELAYKYDVHIVEDDYMADYVIDKVNDPLISYDINRTHVIYLRSFSKIIFPGLRVGFAILPNALVKSFSEIKFYNDMGTSLLAQASLEIYLGNKMYQRQVAKMQKMYKKRANILAQAIKSSCQGVCEYNESIGNIIHTCIGIDNGYKFKKIEQEGIMIADVENYYYSKPRKSKKYLPINVSNVNEKQIKIGISKLMKVISMKS